MRQVDSPAAEVVFTQEGGEAGAVLYRFPMLDSTGVITHAFTTRLGGVSPAPWGSLNVGSTTRDDAAHVRENRRRVEEASGLPLVEWVRLEHGAVVREVTAGSQAAFTVTDLPRADACITRQRGLPLAIYTADCVPVLLLDPEMPALGLVHAGWRGTVAEVSARTLEAMRDAFGTRPSAVLAAVGASIGPCCMEVGHEVTAVVSERFPAWQDSVLRAFNEEKSTIDLWELNVLQLEKLGVPRAQVAVSRLCTACQGERFFSWRRDRGETGRLAMVAALTD